jgi:uncharacterized protein YuzE
MCDPMLIAYEPNSDVLTITLAAGVAVQSQVQGLAQVNYDADGAVSSIQIADASTVLFENGGQINVALPDTETVVVTEVTRTTV